eukprot:scaffold31695_cov118-Isochrysis_galbana.AAC.7
MFTPLQTYDMWQYLVSMYDTPMDASRTDDYITIRRLSIAEHIGFDADSIQRFGSKIIALNSKLNQGDRLDDTSTPPLRPHPDHLILRVNRDWTQIG